MRIVVVMQLEQSSLLLLISLSRLRLIQVVHAVHLDVEGVLRHVHQSVAIQQRLAIDELTVRLLHVPGADREGSLAGRADGQLVHELAL